MTEIIYTTYPVEGLDKVLNGIDYDSLFVITDSNLKKILFERRSDIGSYLESISSDIITFPEGECNKNISTVCDLWTQLSENGASRKSVVINLGGGVTTDMGGFVVSTFKRGLRYVNVPTTLLSMVDASVGGKTGIDFAGLKNEVGTFAFPIATIIDTDLLKTLPSIQILSGMGEVVKMAMLRSRQDYVSLIKDFFATDDIIRKCVEWKKEITEADPNETGLRKLLNFGHTAGHAFESILTERGTKNVSHGMCVAHGIMVALLLSKFLMGFPSERIYEYKTNILSHYRMLPISCKDRELIVDKISHDKKNSAGCMRFVLLKDIAAPEYDVAVSRDDLESALDVYLMNEL